MKTLFVPLFLAMFASSVMAQPADWQKTWDQTLAAARKEGKVVVAAPPDAQVRQLLPAAFKARYGITMEYISARGTDTSPSKLRSMRFAKRSRAAVTDALRGASSGSPHFQFAHGSLPSAHGGACET